MDVEICSYQLIKMERQKVQLIKWQEKEEEEEEDEEICR
jgi:hypothetical protein